MRFTSRPRTFSDIVKQSTAGLIQELVLISLHILSAGVLQYPLVGIGLAISENFSDVSFLWREDLLFAVLYRKNGSRSFRLL